MAGRNQPKRGPIPGPAGSALALVYARIIGRINHKFDAGKGVVRFDRPVISIGNLSVGGTGKTPMVMFLVQALLDSGRRPCIAMRGYAAEGGESDEAAAYRRRFPDVPIIARANRIQGLIELFGHEYREESEASDCIVLDDGFQHRQIARDLDIVLVDASRNPFADRLLPAGWLREPVASLARAGAIVITHAESVPAADITALDRQIAEARRGHGADAVARHAWSGLIVRETKEAGEGETARPVQWLADKRALAVCAIGNPSAFLTEARRAAGGTLAGEVVLKDHDRYAAGTVGRIIEAAKSARAGVILTTDKDWSKLARIPSGAWPCPIARAQLDMRFDRGGEDLAARTIETVARGVAEEAEEEDT